MKAAIPKDVWAPDTRFGYWFQQTRVWTLYVLEPAVEEWMKLLRSVSAPSRFEHVLDVGCGTGLAFDLLEARFSPGRITAVDVDPAVMAAARQAAAECDCPVEVLEANVEKLGLPDESIDLVFCHQTLHHVVDQPGTFRELHRVLRPAGLLLLAESCRSFTLSLLVRALFHHEESTQRTAQEYRQLARDAGFAIEAEQLSRPFWSKPDFGLVERLTGRAPESQEPTQIALVASRPGLRGVPG